MRKLGVQTHITDISWYHTCLAICRQSGNATTHDTTPELSGFRSVFRSLGVLLGPDFPSWRTSQTSTVPLRLPAYIWAPSADQQALETNHVSKQMAIFRRKSARTERHQGGVFSLIQSLPTPLPGVLILRSHSMTCPSIDAVINRSGEYVTYCDESSSGGAFLGGGIWPSVARAEGRG